MANGPRDRVPGCLMRDLTPVESFQRTATVAGAVRWTLVVDLTCPVAMARAGQSKSWLGCRPVDIDPERPQPRDVIVRLELGSPEQRPVATQSAGEAQRVSVVGWGTHETSLAGIRVRPLQGRYERREAVHDVGRVVQHAALVLNPGVRLEPAILPPRAEAETSVDAAPSEEPEQRDRSR
jgi:hypothetical protein